MTSEKATITEDDTGITLWGWGVALATVSSVEAWRDGEALEPLTSLGFPVDLDAVFEACADGDDALAHIDPPAPTTLQCVNTALLAYCIEEARK